MPCNYQHVYTMFARIYVPFMIECMCGEYMFLLCRYPLHIAEASIIIYNKERKDFRWRIMKTMFKIIKFKIIIKQQQKIIETKKKEMDKNEKLNKELEKNKLKEENKN